MKSFLEEMWNNVEYALNDSPKFTGQLDVCSKSKEMQSVLNGITFKYHFCGGRFHMLPQSYKYSLGICLNNFLQVLLIGNQIYQVNPFRYINRDDEVSRLMRGSKVIGDTNYLMSSVKQEAEAVGIWAEENWDMKWVNSLYTMVYGRFNFRRNETFDSLS